MSAAWDSLWLGVIESRLSERDFRENRCYQNIVSNYSNLRDQFLQLNVINARLRRENALLEHENHRLSTQGHSGISNNTSSSELEQKLLKLQEEVIDLHREREKLQAELKSRQAKIDAQFIKMDEMERLIADANQMNRSCMASIEQLKAEKETILNEQTANLLAIEALEQDKRVLVGDRNKYLMTINGLQSQIEKLRNVESDLKRQFELELIQRGLVDAAGTPSSIEGEWSHQSTQVISSVPDKISSSINSSEDVNCVRFSKSGKLFAFGGLDRKVWVGNVTDDNKYDSLFSLVGCNASITAVDFDAKESMVLGASSDFACRIWSLTDRRLRINLTGHSNSVLSARFFSTGESANSVVTSSSDRTIKVWDLKQRQCLRTIPITSLCYDIVPNPATGRLVSGHSDKKLRFWSQDSGKMVGEILLSERVTGVDISKDGNYVLACTRSDTLHMVDQRQRNEVLRSFQAEDFHVRADCVRPCFSPDGAYVACGSQNGCVFIWNTVTGILENILRGHDHMVVCTNWSPSGNQIVSCERGKKVAIWTRA